MADSDTAVTLEQVVQATTPQQRADAGLLTQREATAIQNAADQLRRDALGIPTYDRSILNTIPTEPTVIAYSPEKAASRAMAETAYMGTPGTAMNKFMTEQVAAGVPATLALNLWQSGGSQGGGAQDNYYKQIKGLQDAGYSTKDAYQMVEHVAVAEPTEAQLEVAKGILEQYTKASMMPNADKTGYVVNPHFAYGLNVDFNTPTQLADVKSDIKKMETTGMLDRRVEIAKALVSGERSSISGGGTGSALSIFQDVKATGGKVDPFLSTKAEAQYETARKAQAAEANRLASSLSVSDTSIAEKGGVPAGVATNIPSRILDTAFKPTTKTQDSVFSQYGNQTGVQVGNVFMYDDNKTVKNTETGQIGTIKNGGIYWQERGAFGRKDKTVTKKNPTNKKNTYGSGFLGMITELNRSTTPKTMQQKPQQKKQTPKKPSEPKRYDGTWANIFLTDKKITNTKKSVLNITKPKITAPTMSVKKPAKKQTEGSAWEQILFSKKPKQQTKSDKPKKRGV